MTLATFLPNGNISFENARILFRNFSGEAGMYNVEGKRNFCLVLPNDVAARMAEEGWNIKELKARDDDEEPTPYIKVNVNIKKDGHRNPVLTIINSIGRVTLDENTASSLDWAEFENIDLVITPYDWEVNGSSGRTAYLKSFYGVIAEDPLEIKYAESPDRKEESVMECKIGEPCWEQQYGSQE